MATRNAAGQSGAQVLAVRQGTALPPLSLGWDWPLARRHPAGRGSRAYFARHGYSRRSLFPVPAVLCRGRCFTRAPSSFAGASPQNGDSLYGDTTDEARPGAELPPEEMPNSGVPGDIHAISPRSRSCRDAETPAARRPDDWVRPAAPGLPGLPRVRADQGSTVTGSVPTAGKRGRSAGPGGTEAGHQVRPGPAGSTGQDTGTIASGRPTISGTRMCSQVLPSLRRRPGDVPAHPAERSRSGVDLELWVRDFEHESHVFKPRA